MIRQSNVKIGNVSKESRVHNIDKIGIENKTESGSLVLQFRKNGVSIKIEIFIEFDVSCEQDSKGVGQTKLIEGLNEQKKEADY